MAFEITGHKPGLEGAFVRTQAHTAADALRFAREWAEQGLTGITIVNPKGKSYDIDRFPLDATDAARGLQRCMSFWSPAGSSRAAMNSRPTRHAMFVASVHNPVSPVSAVMSERDSSYWGVTSEGVSRGRSKADREPRGVGQPICRP